RRKPPRQSRHAYESHRLWLVLHIAPPETDSMQEDMVSTPIRRWRPHPLPFQSGLPRYFRGLVSGATSVTTSEYFLGFVSGAISVTTSEYFLGFVSGATSVTTSG